mmetsp:Transcript_18623/g.53274  ORF Transcript_18623/g.53274 Transcript_18623/m.53274 type:complete len:225 (-) Transcript_18623:1662-2336(-)
MSQVCTHSGEGAHGCVPISETSTRSTSGKQINRAAMERLTVRCELKEDTTAICHVPPGIQTHIMMYVHPSIDRPTHRQQTDRQTHSTSYTHTSIHPSIHLCLPVRWGRHYTTPIHSFVQGAAAMQGMAKGVAIDQLSAHIRLVGEEPLLLLDWHLLVLLRPIDQGLMVHLCWVVWLLLVLVLHVLRLLLLLHVCRLGRLLHIHWLRRLLLLLLLLATLRPQCDC